ncbi:MAG TPA: phage holin family protein [Acidimicrobiia bacterium]|jgi:hypothetical protein|nr:phage holin family protein [Acidimicrobiia bacterium]
MVDQSPRTDISPKSDDYPAQIAGFLEDTATQIRRLSVDRLRKAATWTAVGMVVAMLALVLVIFLLVGLFRILAELTTVEIAYLILGGIFLIAGMFLWSKRNTGRTTEQVG